MERTAGKSLRTRRAMEQAIHLIFLLCGIVAVGFVLCISVYLVISGLPAIREIGLTKFLFGKVWAPTNATTGPQFGILPFILTSVYGTAGALLLGVPVGLMTAIFLAKAAPPRLAAVIRTAVQLLAGIPSVVYGLVGMIVLVPAIRRAFGLGSGACLLAAILVLTVMVLPSIINVAAGRRTPDVVQQIRQRHPSIPLLASGGSTDESMAETIVAGANALTWTPPNAQEMQRSMMMRYRGESTGDNMQH